MNKKPEIKRIIQRCGCDSILPFALIYVFYIILHGHLSPGGGFQGGVLMAGIVILLYLGHGFEATVDALSYHTLHKSEGFASVVYVALALMGVAVGAQFLDILLLVIGRYDDNTVAFVHN